MILVFAETSNGQFRKSTFEAINYASSIAKNTNDTVTALVLGECNNAALLGEYGANKVLHANDVRYNNVDSNAYAKAIVEIANTNASNLIICSNTITGKAIAPNVAANLEAGIVSGAISLPDTSNGFVIKKGVFSGKAFAFVNIKSDKGLVTKKLVIQ